MADEVDVQKPRRGRPPKAWKADPVTAPENDAAPPGKIPRPRLSVLERSLQHPFGIPSSPVELKEKGLVCRWVNTELKGGAQFQYALSHGWMQVRPEYVKDLKQVQHVVSPDGFVVRGQRGTELLMYTTIEHFNDRKLAKDHENQRMMNPAVMKRDLVEAADKHLGPEASEYLHDHVGPVGEVRTQYERVQKTEPLE